MTQSPHPYKHLEPGDPNNPKRYRICGRKTRNPDAKYDVCTHPAGKRTPHPGKGACWLHGGMSPTGPNSGRYKHGRRAYRTIERIEAALGSGSDRPPKDLQPELNTQRAMLELHLRALEVKLSLADDDEIINVSEQTHDMVGDGGVAQIDEQGILDDHPRAEFSITRELSIPLPTQLSIPELMEAIRGWSNDIVKTSATMNRIDMEDAVTRAELVHLRLQIEQGIEKFIPDRDTQKAFLDFLVERAGLVSAGE